MKNALSKQHLRMLCLAFVAISTLFVSSCEKGTPVDVPVAIEPEVKMKYDSVYFEIGGKSFSGEPGLGGMNQIGNSGYRMKYLDAPKAGMTIYTEYGMTKRGWYAPTDSIYFTCANTNYRIGNELLVISFSQGFHKKDMNKYGSFYFPKDVRNLLNKGKLTFATDYESTNSKNGVAISFAAYGRTSKPESAFEEPLTNYPQDDSVFEIIKTEQIDKDSYYVEAKFELNLFDNNGTKHRVRNGFIRFTLMGRNVFGYLFQ
ncbi:hypothetical protein [Pedobacter frigoris]|uniref:DUF4270 domain-containing protein n=1 Tax=Pedobacter frigoris TaxID=2571272 RepID=A0A4U1CHX1_9SPHI|nr:hypothetical protein [Pedobacter frigoris]TKC06963.1 hypothetical protein FA047_06740 [Pedobacter frigoris]